MDFSAWLPSHLLVAIITLLTIIGQAVALFTYLKTTATKHSQEIKQLAEQMQRQEDRMDKRFTEVNQRISEVRSELKTEMSEIRSELSKMNQNHIAHLSHHES
jgi:uncharacterized protein HemX